MDQAGTLPVIKKFAALNTSSMNLQSSKDYLAANKDQLVAALKENEGSAEKASAAIDQAIKDSQTLLDTVESYIRSVTI